MLIGDCRSPLHVGNERPHSLGEVSEVAYYLSEVAQIQRKKYPTLLNLFCFQNQERSSKKPNTREAFH